MKQLAVVVILGACWSSTPAAQAPSNDAQAKELRCVTAVEHASANVKLADKDVTMAVGECERKRWSRQARECVDDVKVEADLAACGAHHTDLGTRGIFMEHATFEKALRKMEQFTDEICGCKDSQCAQVVSDEMTKWSQEQAKTQSDMPRMTEGDTKRATAIAERMAKCMQAAMSAGMP